MHAHSNRQPLVLVLCLLVAATVCRGSDVFEKQQWTSLDGREITATLLEIDSEEKEAKFRRDDGFLVVIGFDQMSGEDSERLKKAARDLPAEERAEAAGSSKPVEVEIPDRLELDDVPMVKQKGNFCVPASAAMIAGFHGIETDQDQIAYLSSAGSFNNQGTNPHDMLLAMEKLGFDGKALYWKNDGDFIATILPKMKKALVELGPIYISFAPGVFGDSGHGCVIIGYHDRKEELLFHNPWGNAFEKTYQEVAKQARGIVIIHPPQAAPVASEEFFNKLQSLVPKFDGQFLSLVGTLQRGGLKSELVWCSRRDARDDKRFAEDTARDDGRKILDLAFHRNPAVILPASNGEGDPEKYLLVTRPPEGGARFLVREISGDGWSEPSLVTLGRLARNWATRFDGKSTGASVWELPMIELHPSD